MLKNYHVHLYFDIGDSPQAQQEQQQARKLINLIKEHYPFEVGNFWLKPVGPHPRGSCQVLLPKESFGPFIPWLMDNRGGIDIFVHKNTGDDLADHTDHVMWLGKSYELKLDIF